MIYKEFYAGMEWAELPIVALLFFLVAFSLILLRTFAVRRRRDFDAVASLPLADGGTGRSLGPTPRAFAENTTGSEVRP